MNVDAVSVQRAKMNLERSSSRLPTLRNVISWLKRLDRMMLAASHWVASDKKQSPKT